MPQFSQTSKDRLNTCNLELQLLFNYVIQFYDCTVVCGYRTKKAQHQAVIDHLSTIDYPTVHNTKPSVAVDVAPYEVTHIDWSKTQSAHFAGFVMGVAALLRKNGIMKHKIRNGADWDQDQDIDDTTFWDANHFELVLSAEEKSQLKYYET